MTYRRYSELELTDLAALDRPQAEQVAAPRSFVICSTQRSGSFLLCRLLVNAGLGVPHEYFQQGHMQRLCTRWRTGRITVADYISLLRARRQSRNGCFGIKIHWNEFAPIAQEAGDHLFTPETTVFHLVRRDLLAQAASLCRSTATGVWDEETGLQTTAPQAFNPNDPEVILQAAQAIAHETAQWQLYLSARGLSVTTLVYEEVVRDQAVTVRRIAQTLGFAPEQVLEEPKPSRSAPKLDAEVKRRVAALLAARRRGA